MRDLTYKGYTITVDNDGEFVCSELELRADKYATLCSRIDAEHKRVWNRVKVLYNKSYSDAGEVVSADATSVTTSSYGSVMAWISYEDERGRKHREKVDPRWLYADTPENRNAFSEASKLEKQAEQLREQAANCLVGLEKASLPTEKKQAA